MHVHLNTTYIPFAMFLVPGQGGVYSESHLNFFKGILGVKRSAPYWAVLRECGHEPLQFYWSRAAIQFL